VKIALRRSVRKNHEIATNRTNNETNESFLYLSFQN